MTSLLRPAQRVSPQSASTAPLSALVGADSLATLRSGVGRMTLEIVRASMRSSQVEWTGLLLPHGIQEATALNLADGAAATLACGSGAPAAWKVALGRVPGVQVLRRLRHGGLGRRVKELHRAHGGRLVYHEPNMIARPISLPTVVTMNDLSWHHHPDWHPAERLRWIHANLKATMRQASRYVAISQFTKDAVVREFGIPADMVDVIPLAPAQAFRPISAEAAAPTLQHYNLRDRSYVFSISTLEPRKNFDRLLQAHLHLPQADRRHAPLVIAGGKGWGEVLARPEAQSAIQDGTVRLLGHVPDEALVVLTARAAVFAYVSLYEGFGLPVVEAMAAGAPVVASGTTAVGELAEGAALVVDPLDEASIGAGLRTLIEDPALAESLRAKGLERARGYTWDRTLEVLLESWRLALL